MTYKEFIEWAMDNDIVLEEYDIYPDRYTNVPYASGCYKSEYGKWYYYHSIDERTSLTPNGTKKPEEECFKLLFGDLKYKIQQKQKREEAYAKEFEKSCEALSEEERNEEISARNAWLEEERLVNFYMPRNQFAKTQEEIVIDLDRIYEGIDSGTEDNSLYVAVKKIYMKIYNEDIATKLFKIFKYEEKFGVYIDRRGCGKRGIMIFDEIGNLYKKKKEEVDEHIIDRNPELMQALERHENTVWENRFPYERRLIREGQLGE